MISSLPTHLIGKVASLRERSRQRLGSEANEHLPAQLRLWPSDCEWAANQRGLPNAWLRGALFAAIQGKERRVLHRELLASVDGIEIRFTGWQLDQSDLNVWVTVVHLVRMHGTGMRVEFSAYALLRELGYNTGKSAHNWLKSVFARLHSAGIEITHGRFTYAGTLLKWSRDELTSRYTVLLDAGMVKMFEAGWSRTDWDVRVRLRRKPLALWLHGWYISHAKPYPYRIETIRELSGSRNKQIASFSRHLLIALQELEHERVIRNIAIRDGLVYADRVPSASQAKHLVKKAVAAARPATRHLT